MNNTKHFDEAAAQWDEKPSRVKMASEIVEFLIKRTPINPKMEALEYGCGTGIASALLSKKLRKITAADYSAGMLKEVRAKIKKLNIDNIEPLQLDLTREEAPKQTFDFIFSSLAMHHIEDTQCVLNKFHSLLKPGGYVAIVDLDKEDGSFHLSAEDSHVKHSGFDRNKFMAMLKNAGLTNPTAHTACVIERFDDDGTKRGDYPVFMIMAQKSKTN